MAQSCAWSEVAASGMESVAARSRAGEAAIFMPMSLVRGVREWQVKFRGDFEPRPSRDVAIRADRHPDGMIPSMRSWDAR